MIFEEFDDVLTQSSVEMCRITKRYRAETSFERDRLRKKVLERRFAKEMRNEVSPLIGWSVIVG